MAIVKKYNCKLPDKDILLEELKLVLTEKYEIDLEENKIDEILSVISEDVIAKIMYKSYILLKNQLCIRTYNCIDELEIFLKNLSYSEYSGFILLLKTVKEENSLLNISKLSSESNISRSTFVNMLKKAECSGLIKTSSCGKLGTNIYMNNRIKNEIIDVMNKKMLL